MAHLHVETDMFTPGRWTLRSDHPGALAAAGDVFVHTLGLQHDVLSAWALHYDEQIERAEDAYATERQELGPHAQVNIRILPRTPRPNFVWIDRMHLLATSASPGVASRLLGLYVGPRGDLRLSIHDPSATGSVAGELQRIPDLGATERDSTMLVDWSRVVLAVDEAAPGVLRVLAPPPQALAVQSAITQLQAAVAHL